jgi:hypothetical protein
MYIYTVGDDKVDVRDKDLVKAERVLSLWTEDMKQKRVQVDGHTIDQEVLRLYEHVSRSERSRYISAGVKGGN